MEANGYALFEVYAADQIPALRREFVNTCRQFPEFIPFSSGDPTQFVLGGFSALGNPSSFHNLFVRLVRLEVYQKVFPLLKTSDNRVQALFDRMLCRPPGSSPGRETWHRDITPGLEEEHDTCYGGWVNLDAHSQFFSCVPGTHRQQQQQPGEGGFSPVSKEQALEFKDLKKKVEILPGQGILFRQDLVHEVLPTKVGGYTQLRVFHGFKVTTDPTAATEPLFGEEFFLDTIRNQGVPKLPSGQTPPMYAKQHVGLHTQKLLDFSAKLIPRCVTKNFVHRFMNSLKTYDLLLYPEYSKHERAIFYFK